MHINLVSKFAAQALALALLGGCSNSEDEVKKNNVTSPIDSRVTDTPQSAPAKAPTPLKWDGPLGVEMGLTLEQLTNAGIPLKELKTGIYSSHTSPSPNENFERYTYVISEKTGLCKIIGMGKDIESNTFGTQIQDAFKRLESALTEKYGPPTDVRKFVKKGSLWDSDNYWMMGLSKEERYHSVFWMAGDKGANLPNIRGIQLKAQGQDSSTGSIVLIYDFSNILECNAANSAKANESL